MRYDNIIVLLITFQTNPEMYIEVASYLFIYLIHIHRIFTKLFISQLIINVINYVSGNFDDLCEVNIF